MLDCEIFDFEGGLESVGERVQLFHDCIISATSLLRCNEKCIIMAYIYVERYVSIKNSMGHC